MLMECRTCPARGAACDGCLVSVLVDGPVAPLDAREAAFVAQLVGAGLVDRAQAEDLHARLDRPQTHRLPVLSGRAG